MRDTGQAAAERRWYERKLEQGILGTPIVMVDVAALTREVRARSRWSRFLRSTFRWFL